MSVTKIKATQRQAASVVSTTTVESYSSTTKMETFTHSSGKMLPGWAFPSLTMSDTDSPQNWVPGSQALFLTPKSPSPKQRVTQRSSVYLKKTGKTPPGKGEFKVPLPARLKTISSPVSTRTRRSSIYKKGATGSAAITSYQVTQEFKTTSAKSKQSPKGKQSKSPAATKSSRKRNMAEVEREDIPDKPAAKRRRGQLALSGPKSSPTGKQKGTALSQKRTRQVSKAKTSTVRSRQAVTSTRARKGSAKTPSKKTTKQSPAKTKTSPQPKTSSPKKGRPTNKRKGKDKEEKGDDENIDEDQDSGTSQARKRKSHPDSPDGTTPKKSASQTTSKSRSVKKSARKTTSKTSEAASMSTKSLEQSTDAAASVSQKRSASTRKKVKTPKSGRKSASKSSIKKSTSKLTRKPSQVSKSTRKTAKRRISLEEDTTDPTDGSFLQVTVQKSGESPGKMSNPSASPKGSSRTQSKVSRSASKSARKPGRREAEQKSETPRSSQESSKRRSTGKSASRTQKPSSSAGSAQKNVILSQGVEEMLDGSYIQVSLKKMRTPKTTPVVAGGKVTPVNVDISPISASTSKTSANVSKTARQEEGLSRRSADLKKTPSPSRRTPSPKASSRLRTIQKYASTSFKRLNLTTKRTPQYSAVDISTPKSTGRHLSLTSLQKSANLSRTQNDESFSTRLKEKRELVMSETANGSSEMALQGIRRSDIFSPRTRSTLASQSRAFSQYIEHKASNTVERYGGTAVEHTVSSLTYAGGFRIERGKEDHLQSVEGFQEWKDETDATDSAMGQSKVEDDAFGTSVYSSRCAIL